MDWQLIGSIIISTGVMQIIISLAGKQLTDNKVTKEFRCGSHEKMQNDIIVFASQFELYRKDIEEIKRRLLSFDTEVFRRLEKIESNMLTIFKFQAEGDLQNDNGKKKLI